MSPNTLVILSFRYQRGCLAVSQGARVQRGSPRPRVARAQEPHPVFSLPAALAERALPHSFVSLRRSGRGCPLLRASGEHVSLSWKGTHVGLRAAVERVYRWSLQARSFSLQGWGLIDLPLRASNEGSPRPRVARAQKIIRLHPLLCSALSFPAALVYPLKGGLVDPLMRASNEHILIVRVPRAGGRPGCPSSLIVGSPRAATSHLGFA